MNRVSFAMASLDAVIETAERASKDRLILWAPQNVIVGVFCAERPHRRIGTEDATYPIVNDRRADAELQGHRARRLDVGFGHLERHRQLVRLPTPSRWFSVSLTDCGRDDVAEESAQFDQKWLGGESEDTQVSDLLAFNSAAQLRLELAPEVLTLKRPVGRLIVAECASNHFEIQGLSACRMMIGGHRGEDRLRRHQRLVVTDAGRESHDMGRPVFINACDRRDPRFMLRLHSEKNRLRMVGDGLDIDQLVVTRAHEHEVAQASRKLGRSDRIAAGTSFDVCNDMRNEAEDAVLAAGDQVADQIRIASPVLTSTTRPRP